MTPLPPVGELPVVAVRDVTDTTTAHGMRVVAVRRPNVPLVQLRLSVPLGDVTVGDAAVLRLLPKMLMAGTAGRSGSEVAAALQRLGALVGAGADVDDLSVSAGIPSAVLGAGLDELADIVAHPAFPTREVAGERERVVQDVLQEAVDPVSIATRALAARLFPRHPYAEPLPAAGTVRRIGRTALARLHSARVHPRGSVLVAVGDVDPDMFGELAASAFAPWHDTVAATDAAPAVGRPHLDPPRATPPLGATVVLDRPGAVQSNLRLGAPCIGRHDPAFPALVLASTVFGGHFTSRLVENLRERHGYTYSPRAGIDERRLAASFAVHAEVGTEVTAPALTEIRYELARLSTTEVSDAELEDARRYVTGVLAMSSATQAGLAGLLGSILANDLEPAYLEQFSRDLADVDAAAVREAAARFLGPAAMTTVVVGDADAVARSLEPLGPVTVVS